MLHRFDKNTQGRDFIVGDVHGHFSLLRSLLKMVEFNAEIDRLFSTGDLVDRGPECEESIYWIRQPWFHAVRGNHEQFVIESDPKLHFMNGGAWFLMLSTGEQNDFRHEFNTLPFAIEIDTDDGKVGIVHAEVPDDDWESLPKLEWAGPQRREHMESFLLWRRDIIRKRAPFHGVANIDKVVVGHSPVKEVTQIHNVTYLDTGMGNGRALTLLCIQGEGAGTLTRIDNKDEE